MRKVRRALARATEPKAQTQIHDPHDVTGYAMLAAGMPSVLDRLERPRPESGLVHPARVTRGAAGRERRFSKPDELNRRA
jgi:hypothetical protein